MICEENLEVRVEPNAGWDPRIQIIACGDLVRAYLIKTERFVLVYDTLLGPKSGGFLREQALELGQGRPLLVVNSHSDWDHYFGNMVFPETILATELAVRRITGEVGTKELAQKRAEHPACYGGVELHAPTVGIPSHATLHGGDLTLELFLSKGHRPDHLALFIPQISTLLPGDCVEEPIPLVDEDSDDTSRTFDELIASLHQFVRSNPEWVLANHAPPERGVDRILRNIKYLEDLRQAAMKAGSLESLLHSHPAREDWGDFYQKAHQNQVRMAWEQTRKHCGKWTGD